MLALAREKTGLKIITEVLSERDVEHVAETADILQIGARNSQNFQLLIEAAKTGKPILLKRGMSERIEEWLLARRVHPGPWQSQCAALRARYPHV